MLVKRIVQQFLDEVVNELGKTNRLEFRDFGVFETKLRKARKAQNPKTLEPVSVPEKRTVKFKVGRLMKAKLAELSGTAIDDEAGDIDEMADSGPDDEDNIAEEGRGVDLGLQGGRGGPPLFSQKDKEQGRAVSATTLNRCPLHLNPEPRMLNQRLLAVLDARRVATCFRQRRPVKILDATRVEIDGGSLINFSGNDYLGLSHHPALTASSCDVSGAGASALVSGYTTDHADTEACIARWKGTESAVLLPSGYQANHAAIQTFAGIGGNHGEGVRFLLDKLSHASLIDAVRSTRCPFRIFPHNDVAKVRRLLESAPGDQLQVIVTESIFSMDGDASSLPGLCELREKFHCALLVDEAHGSGVYGPSGAGLAAELSLSDSIDVTVCTFSKAAGLVGGAVCGTQSFGAAVVNFGRAYIYSTAIPPTTARQIRLSIELMSSESWRQTKVRALAREVRAGLTSRGWRLPPGDSPIIPIIVGNEANAIQAATSLEKAGLLAIAIRPPTVASQSCRIRITVNAEHKPEQITVLLEALEKFRQSNLLLRWLSGQCSKHRIRRQRVTQTVLRSRLGTLLRQTGR